MSDQISQDAGNTQTTSDAQPAAGAAVTGAGDNTSAPASSTPAANSQQANDGQPAAGDTTAAASTEGDKGTAGDKPAGAPEKYEFKAPDNVALDDGVIAEFSTVAKELGLPQDAAQKVIDKLAPKLAEQNAQAIMKAMESANTEWLTAAKADKEFGGEKLDENLAVARKALDRFGTPELRKLLGRFDAKENPTGTGLGNHPELIRAFIKAGRAISEDKFVQGSTQPTKGERSLAKSLYPNQPA